MKLFGRPERLPKTMRLFLTATSLCLLVTSLFAVVNPEQPKITTPEGLNKIVSDHAEFSITP